MSGEQRGDLLISYTYNKLIPNAITINKHMRILTLNMHFKNFHTPQLIHGLLYSMLNIDASEALLEAILTYPEFDNDQKDVTVVFSYT